MLFLYNLGINTYNLLLHFAALFNKKAAQWVHGRRGLLNKIAKEWNGEQRPVWFHFASLGEFEQGRPLLEALRRQEDMPIVITFFSPSGYELKKTYPLADKVYYLPIDTTTNARKFVELINPRMAIFTKYEFWHNYFTVLHDRKVPLYVISATFRKKQVFFKWYGSFARKTLRQVTHFFVQDAFSVELLKTIGIENSSVSGDTRFDRVVENASTPRHIPIVADFCQDSSVMVVGSSWPKDERIISEIVKDRPEWKFVIAPHEIKEDKLRELESQLPAGSSQRYSTVKEAVDEKVRVLIIDNVGMLSSLYQYARLAYIGGGFGVGIHNTLEAAAYGVPVIFGPNYHRFIEARELIRCGAGFSIDDLDSMRVVVKKMQYDKFIDRASEAAAEYVRKNKGATSIIMEKILN